MYLSKYFIPLLKETPSEAQVISHQLMLRSGMIRQLCSGIYNWLPLGLRVLKKVENIVREEMDKTGALEILMPSIQPASLWTESERYDAYGKEMLRIKDRHDNDMLYGPTHEEVVTDIFRTNVKSYKELPITLYQIQTKFRDEIRPRFGLMRGREFLMKDAYSFDIDENAASTTYEKIFNAYYQIFKRIGVKAIPLKADTGAIGGSLSHEFHILAESGESSIFYDPRILDLENITLSNYQEFYAATDEKHDASIAPDNVIEKKGIEVGHVFYLGQKYSKVLDAKIQASSGEFIYPYMGCYGIGVSRVVAAVIEALNDKNGIIWPESIAPFKFIITPIGRDEKVNQVANNIYNNLLSRNIEVIIDDRDQSPGSKLSTAELIGIPYNIAIGNKSLDNNSVELKVRGKDSFQVSLDNIFDNIDKICKK